MLLCMRLLRLMNLQTKCCLMRSQHFCAHTLHLIKEELLESIAANPWRCVPPQQVLIFVAPPEFLIPFNPNWTLLGKNNRLTSNHMAEVFFFEIRTVQRTRS
jgi:hypothetical protein